MMESQTIDGLAFESNQQRLEDIDPRERTFTHEAALVHGLIEMPFAPTLHGLSIAFIFRNVWFDATIPEEFAYCSYVKGAICIEYRTLVVQATTIHITEQVLEFLYDLIAVIVLACNNPRGCN